MTIVFNSVYELYFYLSLWWLVGFISVLVFIKVIDRKIKIGDYFLSALFGILGPIGMTMVIIALLIYFSLTKQMEDFIKKLN